MMTTTRSLLDLTAADLMSRVVVTINRKMSLRGAAHLLRRADVTGAPVVDERGRCVGVLSAVDFPDRHGFWGGVVAGAIGLPGLVAWTGIH